MKARDNDLDALARASRRTAVLTLLGFLAILFSMGYSAYRLNREQREVLLLRTQKDTLRLERDALALEVDDLEARKNSLKSAVDTLLSTTRTRLVDVQGRKAVHYAENSTQAIGFYALSVMQDEYDTVRDSLMSRGYPIIRGANLETRPSWLAQRSTVLYYDPRARPKAQELAALLGQLTGREFAIQPGEGLGVMRGEEARTFFIHWVAPRRP